MIDRGEAEGRGNPEPGKSLPNVATYTIQSPDVSAFPEFRDAIRHAVYSSGKPLKAIAAEMGMSPSQLSRKLSFSSADPNYFPAHLLPRLIEVTGDLTPVHWLLDHFFSPARERELSELERCRRALVETAVALTARLEDR